jgi:hypothetical protein
MDNKTHLWLLAREIKDILKIIPKDEAKLRNNLKKLRKRVKRVSPKTFEPGHLEHKMLDYYLKDLDTANPWVKTVIHLIYIYATVPFL